MISLQDIDNIVLNGGIVVDAAGEKIGSVEQIFTSGDSGDPAFVTVRTGLFGMSETFAPLSGASLEDSVIKVAFDKDTIRNGPRIDSDRGAITEAQEQELYRYYGLPAGTGASPADTTAADAVTTAPHPPPPGPPPPPPHGGPGHPPPPPPHGGPGHPPPPPPPHGGPGHPPPPPPPHGGPGHPPPPPPHLHRHVPPR
ncbi:PRC-barrel domain-containing protein [Arthrobacter sp. PM3]|uniref:PRC-barrel domain-containing protein n=1 Tax=Arthrobacter sp. PM3 TaxID=2017685 RepID=UPI001ABF4CC1|nr:PRC-barrel domain-containing protein [Arthrobacter sp. PM3]